jgi:hypothetical protein
VAKAVRYEIRFANWEDEAQRKSGRVICRYCFDTGWVMVALRDPTPATVVARGKLVQVQTALERVQTADMTADVDGLRHEEMAPCPMCQVGYRVEFPQPSDKNPNPGRGPFGEDGYWKGRDAVDLVPMEASGSLPLPKAENAKRARELFARMGGIVKEMEAL